LEGVDKAETLIKGIWVMKRYINIILLFITACSARIAVVPTITVQPSAIPSASSQFIPTQEIISSIPAPTKYPIPFAEQKIEEYLRTNNGCSLPCFWGVIPGDTNLGGAIKFFQPFGITKRNSVGLSISSKDVINGASLFEGEGKVIGIEVFGEGTFYDSSSFLKSQETFWKIWGAYLPQSVFTQYGYPDRVWLDTYNNPEVSASDKPFGYSIWFFYDIKGFLLVYSGITTKSPEYQICLGSETGEIGFGNLSPRIEVLVHKDIHLEDFAIEQGINLKVSFYSDKNAEIPINEFKDMIEKQDGCFNTPLGFEP